MKKLSKQNTAVILTVIMLITAIPLSGFVGIEFFDLKETFATRAEAAESVLVFKTDYPNQGEAVVADCIADASGVITIPSIYYRDNGENEPPTAYHVVGIESYAFSNCDGVTSITIPNSVTSIGVFAFSACDGITEITIPDSITSISNDIFNGCRSLTSVTIPDKVTNIGNGAFNGCESLTSITIPDSVTSIGEGAFYNCDGLTNIIIPNSITSIEKNTFSNCSNLASITISDSITSIGEYAFNWCESLTNVIIPDGVISIGEGAFNGCEKFTSVTIPDSVTSIGESAFSQCKSLENVVIGKGVTSIGAGAFSLNTKLNEITVDKDNGYYSSDDYGVLFNKSKTELIQYPTGNTRKTYTIPSSVISFGSAFARCKNLTSVIIGKNVTSIDYNAFNSCSHLTSITIPDSVTSIGDNAFYDCNSLTSITIPDSVTSIGDLAFYQCYVEDVYYSGTESQWNTIAIGKYNDCLLNANIHFNSTGPVVNPTEPTTKPDEPTTKPVENPVTKPTEPTTKPVEVPTTKPVEVPTTKPVEAPTTKPVEVPTTKPTTPTTKPTEPTKPTPGGSEPELYIEEPSVTAISYGDSIILHADVELPAGAKVVWTADNENFSYTVSEDGKTCTITPESSGDTTFTAKAVDKDGNVISNEDTQTMTAKAGFFQKIIAFFKSLFGLTKIIPEAVKFYF